MFFGRRFPKKRYPTSLLDNCFKRLLDRLHCAEKHLDSRLLSLSDISLLLRINFYRALKESLNCCKLQGAFKNQRKFSNALDLKTVYLTLLTLEVCMLFLILEKMQFV